MTGVAMNVTDVPSQTGFADALIVTITGNRGLTVMVIALEVAGLPVVQAALDVSTQVTVSPLTGVYVKAGVFIPEFVPLTFH